MNFWPEKNFYETKVVAYDQIDDFYIMKKSLQLTPEAVDGCEYEMTR